MKMKPKENLAKIKESLLQSIRKVFIQELYVEGEDPPKSYLEKRNSLDFMRFF